MSKEKTVLYVLTKLELGGAQKVCLALMHEARKRDFSVALVTGSEGALQDQAKRFDNVYFLDSFKREVSIKNLFYEIKTFFTLIRLMRSLQNQGSLIVHTHSTKAGIMGRWAAWIARVPFRVHTVHGFGFNPYQSWVRWFIIWLCEALTAFITTQYICVSEKDQQVGRKLLPTFAQKNYLIRAAIELDLYAKTQKMQHDDTFIVGTVSCFKPQKNLIDLCKAFKLMQQVVSANIPRKSQLVIVGDGILRPKIEQWIIENNMSESIILVGWSFDIPGMMKQWDLFAMSSLWEGLPCSVVEARASGLPVVAYAIDGIPEVIFHDKNGYLAQQGDWQALGGFMSAFMLDQKLYERCSAYVDDLTEFSYQRMFEKHYQLYQSL